MRKFFLAVGLTVAMGACSSAAAPEAALEELVRIGESGDCQRLPQLISKSGRDMVGPKLEAGCRQAQEERKKDPAKAEKKLKRINVLNRQESGEDRVTLRAEPEYEDGSKDSAQDFVMVREEGAWKIDIMASGKSNGQATPK
jgi:hypothetical protein